MEELNLERQLVVAPERAVGIEPDLAIGVVGEVLERCRQIGVGRLVGFLRKVARELAYLLGVEGGGLFLPRGQSCARAERQRAEERQRQAGHDHVAAMQARLRFARNRWRT